ncbi:MAG: endonuclease III [Candidatus Omnitrophica bacterium]|nr:endonuclease III [Candidatus Omnitrophota bacterium]MBU4488208.1 endonuclease III [Candidatus Omnitrophota bacterium]MCG2705389.1 endonuclease III [Candidatus Omnitrophota bacterium]
MKSRKDRIKPVIRILRKKYPFPRTSLRHKNVFHLLVATILSAQCTDERVNKITPGLFKKYNTISAFACARRSSLEKDIRSTGFYRNKAKNIIAASQKILRDYNGRVPDSMKELVMLAGVARKTANIVLSSGFGKAEGIAVDTHVKRLSQRLGFSKEVNPERIEKDLMLLVPKEDWLDFNYLLVNYGREICMARKPLCPKCIINKLCPSRGIFYPALTP